VTNEAMREAVSVFPDEPSFRAAVDELLVSGFDSIDLTVVARRRSPERKLGAMYRDVAELENDPQG